MSDHAVTYASRFDSRQREWHTHSFTHVHDAGERTDEPHVHILTTDDDTTERLRRLLREAARPGALRTEYKAEAAELLALIR